MGRGHFVIHFDVGIFSGVLYRRCSEAEACDQACSLPGFNSAIAYRKHDREKGHFGKMPSLTAGLLTQAKRLFGTNAEEPFFFHLRTPAYGCGVGVGCACGSRRNVGGAGLLGSAFCVPSGFVVVESSGVGFRRFSVGRPGVPSSAPAIAPVEDARAFDNLSRRFFTR